MMTRCYVGVKGVITRGKKVLLLKSKARIGPTPYYWDLPGGRIDNNESIQEALDRELHEEILNLGAYKQGRLLNVWRAPYDFKDGTGLVLVMYQVFADLEVVELSSEHLEYRWVGSQDVKELSSMSDIEFPAGYEQAIRQCLKSV